LTKILIVEDDRSLRDALSYNLRREDYTPVTAEDAPTALITARKEKPDLILLDLMLPGGNGFDVCRDIRTFTPVPIIMLTARGEDIDRVLGLEIGADDYVTKPFALRELLARIKANLRRVDLDRGTSGDDVMEHSGLTVDVPGRRVLINGKHVSLQPREFDLLAYLIRHPGTVLTRARLLSSVWGHDFVGERTVDVHVRRVRAKLEQSTQTDFIRTVHSVGYVFDPEPREVEQLSGA
jgi:DNA-binding response OmpR family regulator